MVVDTRVETAEEGNMEAAVDTKGENGPTKGCTENPKVHKVFLRKKKRKVVATPEIEEQPQKTRVKKPSQWVSSLYTTKGQWIKHVDAIDLFRDVDPVQDKEFSKWYNQLGDG
ncbi:hypothetical protein Fot_05059 [Forsythia ovata]|uniref:Uncharacterized protein n=1 Tax=Forsythia ovata TaxID=205694 RepID=A0ABD1WPP3_9LAMI